MEESNVNESSNKFERLYMASNEEAYMPSGILTGETIKRDIMSRLTGVSDFSKVVPSLTWQMILGIMLLYFRFMTAEMLIWLFPDCSGLELGLAKSRLEKKGFDYIETIRYKGLKAVYTLKQDGFDYFRSLLPENNLITSRIPNNIGQINANMVIHDTDMRMVLCSYLRYGNKAYARWYTSICLFNGVSPEECIRQAIDNRDKSQEGNTAGVIKADAIMDFGDNIAMIEQDTGSERGPVIGDKIEKYAEYFSSLERQSYQVIFNVRVNNGFVERTNSRNSVVKNIKEVMQILPCCTNLQEAYTRISSSLLANPRRVKNVNMYTLLSDYVKDGGDLAGDISALEKYVYDKRPHEIKHEKRALYIKKVISNLYEKKESQRKAIENGLSIPVTWDIYRQAYYINAYDSGFLEKVESEIKRNYPPVFTLYRHRTAKFSGRVYRNTIVVRHKDETVAMYLVSEISADMAEYIRMTEMMKVCDRYNRNLNFLFVVACHEDAWEFAKETGCVEKFCSDNVEIPERDNKITIRFMCYNKFGIGLDKLFIPKPDGSVVYLANL